MDRWKGDLRIPTLRKPLIESIPELCEAPSFIVVGAKLTVRSSTIFCYHGEGAFGIDASATVRRVF
jgi:hypothetical protein